MKTVVNGVALKASYEAIMPKLTSDNFEICQLLSKGETEKALKFIQGINKHKDEAKKLGNQLLSVLLDAAKKDTKTTFPLLLWYKP